MHLMLPLCMCLISDWDSEVTSAPSAVWYSKPPYRLHSAATPSVFFHFYCKLWRDLQRSDNRFLFFRLSHVYNVDHMVCFMACSLSLPAFLILWTTEESWVVSVSTRTSRPTNAHLDFPRSHVHQVVMMTVWCGSLLCGNYDQRLF